MNVFLIFLKKINCFKKNAKKQKGVQKYQKSELLSRTRIFHWIFNDLELANSVQYWVYVIKQLFDMFCFVCSVFFLCSIYFARFRWSGYHHVFPLIEIYRFILLPSRTDDINFMFRRFCVFFAKKFLFLMFFRTNQKTV